MLQVRGAKNKRLTQRFLCQHLRYTMLVKASDRRMALFDEAESIYSRAENRLSVV